MEQINKDEKGNKGQGCDSACWWRHLNKPLEYDSMCTVWKIKAKYY